MLVGWLSARGTDRSPLRAFLTFQVGSLVIFGCGVVGLMVTLAISFPEARRLGWLPFLPGDLLETAASTALFPSAWLAVDRFRRTS